MKRPGLQRLTFTRGFTLVELAVVLLIVAVLLGGLLIPLSAQQDIRARQETEKRLNDVREALLGFAVAHRRLPRPAVSATDGAEAGPCASEAACTGFVPWATLGVEKTDAWGKLIRYSVSRDYANGTITLTTVANRTVQTRDAAGTASYLAGQASCTTASQCVPAIAFSHGRERWGTSDSGTAFADGSATNTDEDANNTGPINYFSRLPSPDTTGPGGEFDDLVVWLPATVLFNRMVAAGSLP